MLGQDHVGVANGRALVLDTGKCKDWPLMQYTGMKDKNGREIYDGDVIDSGQKRSSDGSRILYVVKWSKGAMGWDLEQLGRYCMTGGLDANNVLVIGNVYENPDLRENGDAPQVAKH